MFGTALVLIVLLVLGRKLYAMYLAPRLGGRAGTFRQSKLPQDAQSAFIVCTFSLLRQLAEIDGRVSKTETQRVKQFIVEQLEMRPSEAKLAMKVYKEAAKSPLEMADYADRFSRSYPDRVQLHDRMIKVLLEVAFADGECAAEELSAIRSVALRLGVSEPAFERMTRGVAGKERTLH